MKKIFCITLIFVLLFSVLSFSASAESYTEYYQYSGSGISSTTSNILQGYAFNILNDYSNSYDSWFAVRVGQYQYLICVFTLTEDFEFSSLPEDGTYILYDERMYSYQDNTYRYQPGFKFVNDVSLTLTRSYLIGNCFGTISVDSSSQSSLDMKYVRYILYTLIIFLLLFVMFKFLNKRWLLP